MPPVWEICSCRTKQGDGSMSFVVLHILCVSTIAWAGVILLPTLQVGPPDECSRPVLCRRAPTLAADVAAIGPLARLHVSTTWEGEVRRAEGDRSLLVGNTAGGKQFAWVPFSLLLAFLTPLVNAAKLRVPWRKCYRVQGRHQLRIFGCHYRGSQNPQALQHGLFVTTETRGSKQRKTTHNQG